jgi:hypothetical protein
MYIHHKLDCKSLRKIRKIKKNIICMYIHTYILYLRETGAVAKEYGKDYGKLCGG